MKLYRNINDLCLFIKGLASSLKLNNPGPYEAASFIFQNENKNSDSDFSGFNLYLMENILANFISPKRP